MHPEAEVLLQKATQVRTVSNRGRVVQRGTRYMTHTEKESKQSELERIEETLSPGNVGSSAITQEGRANLHKYRQYLRSDLEENVAPEVPRQAVDDLVAAERALAEEISEGMLPHEVMRRNPPGSVSHHIKWREKLGDKIFAWKNLRRMLNPDDTSEDVANVEMLRKSSARLDGAPTFVADAQIPGVFAMTPQAKANWPEGMAEYGTLKSALKQAEERELRMAADVALLKKRIEDQDKQIEAQNNQVAHLMTTGQVKLVSRRKKELGQLQKNRWQKYREDVAAGREPELKADWTCERCGENLPKTFKGGHIMKHNREDRVAAKAAQE